MDFETRQVICANSKGKLYDNQFCKKSKYPETVRNCTPSDACEYQWYATQWSEVHFNTNYIIIVIILFNTIYLYNNMKCV